MSGCSILKGGEQPELSTQLSRALSVTLGQRKPLSAALPAASEEFPCHEGHDSHVPLLLLSLRSWAILVVWAVSGERTWHSSPLLHNPAVPAQRHAPPRAGSCCRWHGLQNPFAADISFLSSFSLTPLLLWNNQSNPVSSCCKSHPIKKEIFSIGFSGVKLGSTQSRADTGMEIPHQFCSINSQQSCCHSSMSSLQHLYLSSGYLLLCFSQALLMPPGVIYGDRIARKEQIPLI